MHPTDYLIYQIATHHLSKIALRIETLFEQIEASLQVTHSSAHHLSLLHTLELSKLAEKPELKSRFLKELMRFNYSLNKQDKPLPEALNQFLQDQIHHLSHLTQRFGEKLLQDPLLQSVSISLHTHHDITIDPPPLTYWLAKRYESRIEDLNHWLDHLQILYETAKIYLEIIRNAAPFENIQVDHGFYQRNIHEKRTCHLILLRLLKTEAVIPKIQVDHYGITLRLCHPETLKEIHHADLCFDLAICTLQ